MKEPCRIAGKFPNDRKVARVTPIYKSGVRVYCSNCKPAAFRSRAFEKVGFNQLLYIRVVGLPLFRGLFGPKSARIITMTIGPYNGNATNYYNILYS